VTQKNRGYPYRSIDRHQEQHQPHRPEEEVAAVVIMVVVKHRQHLIVVLMDGSKHGIFKIDDSVLIEVLIVTIVVQDHHHHNNNKIDTISIMMTTITEGEVLTETIEAVDDLVEIDPVEVHQDNKDDHDVVVVAAEALPMVRTPVEVTIQMMRIDLGVEIGMLAMVGVTTTQSNSKQARKRKREKRQQH
jgi:hypothetical protein